MQIFRRWTTFNKTTFPRIQKNMDMAGGWELKFTFYFMERTHEQLHLVKLSSVHRKVMDISTSFIWIIIFFGGALFLFFVGFYRTPLLRIPEASGLFPVRIPAMTEVCRRLLRPVPETGGVWSQAWLPTLSSVVFPVHHSQLLGL
jgi:hypothetical protein